MLELEIPGFKDLRLAIFSSHNEGISLFLKKFRKTQRIIDRRIA